MILLGSDVGNLLCVTPKEKQQIHVLLSFQDGRSISSLDLHSDNNKVLIGNVDNVLTLYDIENKFINFSKKLPFGSGKILGTIKRNGNLFCINEKGCVTNVDENHVELLMRTAEGLECFLELPTNQNHIAVAGNRCQVTLFDICTKKQIWKGKNPPNDELNIPLPIWISGMCYDNNSIYTVSRHGIISGYDTRASTKPVLYMKDDLSSYTTVSKSFRERSCLVGTNKGSLRLFEFRKSAIFTLNSYKSCVGCVSDIQCNEFTSPLILASSLDRNLHVFNFDTKSLIEQYYLRVRLRKLLVTETIVSFDDMDEEVPAKRIRIH